MRRSLIQVALDWTRPKDPPMSLGHASILANLRRFEVPVIQQSWSVNHEGFRADDVTKFVLQKADKYTDFAIGAFVWNEIHVQNILQSLKSAGFPGRIIVGGPQVSYLKADLEKYYPNANVFIRGYSEQVLVRLMVSSEVSPRIKGVHYAGEPDLSQSASVDLDELPSPFLTGLISRQNFIRWETQRGCPFQCSFCQHRETRLGGEAMKRRNFADSRVFAEAEWLAANKVGDLAVLDPTFNSGPKHIEVIEKLIDAGLRGKIALQIRPEMIKPKFMDAISRLNQQAKVVLEFGLQTIHKEEQKAIGRPNNLQKVESAVAACKSNGISVEISLIFGLPKQTLDSFKQSVDYCIGLKIPTIHAFPLMLLRGTPLYENREKLGLVEGFEAPMSSTVRQQDGIPHVIASPSFTVEDWRKMAEIADRLVLESNNEQDTEQKH